MRALAAIVALLIAPTTVGQVSSGGTYQLNKQVIAGGGSIASGGSFVLIGTVGQSAAGPINGGSYILQQGFHSSTSTGPAPDPIFKNGFE